jgi:transposase-like protein
VTRSRKPTTGRYTEEQKKNKLASYRKLRDEGESDHAACQRIGVDSRTIRRWMKQFPHEYTIPAGELNAGGRIEFRATPTLFPKPLSRSEKEKLCEEWALHQRGKHLEVQITDDEGNRERTLERIACDLMDAYQRERCKAIEDRISKHDLEDYKERAALTNRVKELEDLAVATKESHRRRCAREFIFAVVLFGMTMIVVGSMLSA